MAKITFGPIVAEARNKCGDIVYTRNRGGAVARVRVMTGVRHTALQTAERAAFKAAFQRWWQVLTQEQRTNWNAFADAADPLPKPIGKNHRSGQNWYVSCNATTIYWLGTFVDTPPPDLRSPNLDTLAMACDLTASTFVVDVSPVPAPADQYINLWATKPLSPGITNWGKYLRRLSIFDNTAIFPTDIWAAYAARFGPIATGSRIGLMAQTMDATKGILGPKIIASAIVTGSTGDAMLALKLTLTNAQIKALPTTEIQLLAAPGAGKIIVPIFCTLHLTWTADYTNLEAYPNSFLNLSYGPGLIGTFAAFPMTDFRDLLNAGQDTWGTLLALTSFDALNMGGTPSGFLDPGIANKSLVIHAPNGILGDFTGGDAANKMEINLFYAIADIS